MRILHRCSIHRFILHRAPSDSDSSKRPSLHGWELFQVFLVLFVHLFGHRLRNIDSDDLSRMTLGHVLAQVGVSISHDKNVTLSRFHTELWICSPTHQNNQRTPPSAYHSHNTTQTSHSSSSCSYIAHLSYASPFLPVITVGVLAIVLRWQLRVLFVHRNKSFPLCNKQSVKL